MFSNKYFYGLLIFFSVMAIFTHIYFAGALAASSSAGFWILDIILWGGLGYTAYVAHKHIEDPNKDGFRLAAFGFAILLIVLAGMKGSDYKAKKSSGIAKYAVVTTVDPGSSK
jgi:hypothetical protein